MPESPKIVLGITGSIAAFKAGELLRLMQKKGWDVWVVMTACATQYIGPLPLRALTGHPVPCGTFAEAPPDTYSHLDLSAHAAAMVVARLAWPAVAVIVTVVVVLALPEHLAMRQEGSRGPEVSEIVAVMEPVLT